MLKRVINYFTKSQPPGWDNLVDIGRQTAAGIHVSPDSALRCAPVFAGVKVRSETIGSLPVHIFQRLPGGGKERAKDHPLEAVIAGRANPWTASPQLVMELEKDCVLHGSGYALAIRVSGNVKELVRLKPGTVTVEEDQFGEPVYRISTKTGTQSYSWKDILHVPSIDGLSPIRQCADAVGLAITLEKCASQIFAKGGRPSGVLKIRSRMNEATLERLKASWNASHTGEGSGKTAILEEGTEFEPLVFKSVDLQFAELRAFQLTEIARALGVPPTLIMDFGRATWGNSEQMAQSFLTFGILPRLKLWQGAIARLLTPEEQKDYYAEFIVDELVKADIAARFEAYSKAIAARILNPNEVREMENRAPYSGGDTYENPNTTAAPASPGSGSKPKVAA